MSSIRILHVDDEPDIREIVDLSLGLNPDFEVHACASGEEAIAAAAEWSPILILLDVMMPGMDGPTTLTHLRKNPKTSGHPGPVHDGAGADPRSRAFLSRWVRRASYPKPFDPMTLAGVVRDHLQTLQRI